MGCGRLLCAGEDAPSLGTLLMASASGNWVTWPVTAPSRVKARMMVHIVLYIFDCVGRIVVVRLRCAMRYDDDEVRQVITMVHLNGDATTARRCLNNSAPKCTCPRCVSSSRARSLPRKPSMIDGVSDSPAGECCWFCDAVELLLMKMISVQGVGAFYCFFLSFVRR